jgi:hypothetical protein
VSKLQQQCQVSTGILQREHVLMQWCAMCDHRNGAADLCTAVDLAMSSSSSSTREPSQADIHKAVICRQCVRGEMTVDVPAALAYSCITDFDRMADIFSNVGSSHVKDMVRAL